MLVPGRLREIGCGFGRSEARLAPRIVRRREGCRSGARQGPGPGPRLSLSHPCDKEPPHGWGTQNRGDAEKGLRWFVLSQVPESGPGAPGGFGITEKLASVPPLRPHIVLS